MEYNADIDKYSDNFTYSLSYVRITRKINILNFAS